MILLDSPQGALRAAVHQALRGSQEKVTFALSADDLFEAALGCRAIVHISAAAAGGRSPEDEAVRVRAVLGAALAPGQRRLVAVLSSASDDDATVPAIRRSGTPYVILRVPRLLEDAGRRLVDDPTRHHWVPGMARERVVAAHEVARRVVAALAADADGVVEELAGETLSWAQIVERLGLDKQGRRIHTLPAPLFRAGQKLGLLRGPNFASRQS